MNKGGIVNEDDDLLTETSKMNSSWDDDVPNEQTKVVVDVTKVITHKDVPTSDDGSLPTVITNPTNPPEVALPVAMYATTTAAK